jgi:hypothetical protein
VTVVVPGACLLLAAALGRREWRQYRAAAEIGSDLFVYSKGRLVRRLAGVVLLAALGLTFGALGLFPPRSPGGVHVYMGVIMGEVVLLLALPILDLMETARTARPGKGLTHQEGARPRTRSPRRRLP